MKKLTKKRLKEIKEHLDFIQFEYDRQGYISTNTADELIEYSKYLIEKVEYWRDQHRKRADELEEAYFKIQLLENKLERYKNHLLCIQKHYGLPSEPTDFVPVTVLHEIQMIVSNALDDGESGCYVLHEEREEEE